MSKDITFNYRGENVAISIEDAYNYDLYIGGELVAEGHKSALEAVVDAQTVIDEWHDALLILTNWLSLVSGDCKS